MIVCDSHLSGVSVEPSESDPVLIVDPDAVEAGKAMSQLLQTVPWGRLQVSKLSGRVQHIKLSDCNRPQARGNATGRPGVSAVEKVLRRLIAEVQDHNLS